MSFALRSLRAGLPIMLLSMVVLLAGCFGASRSTPGDETARELTPLPESIHDERSVTAGADPTDACGGSTECVDHPFKLPRPVVVVANLSWTNPVNAMSLYLFQNGDLVEGQTSTPIQLALRIEENLNAGDYVLRVRPSRMVSDRYVLDVTFHEQPQPVLPSARTQEESASAIAALMAGVPCEATYTEGTTTENLRRLSFTALDGGPREMDIGGDLLLAARLDGFSTFDISDPLGPVIRGHYGDVPGDIRGDIKFTPDNQTALLAWSGGVDVVDIRDPENPVQTDRWNLSEAGLFVFGTGLENAHMVFPVRIDGQDWVFLAPQGMNGVWVLKLEGPPESRSLSYVTRTMFVQGDVYAAHDVHVAFDEGRQQWLLYSADGFSGWKVFDVSDPMAPTLISAVPNHDGASGTHSVQPAWIGNRRLVAVSTEAPLNGLKVYDATVLERPVLVGYWSFESGTRTLEAEHNLNIVDGRLYLAHYTNGLFVFDLTRLGTTPADAFELQPMAHYMGSHRSIIPLGSTSEGFWDLVVHEGLLYAGVYGGQFEMGLHVIGYGCITPGDPLQTSTG